MTAWLAGFATGVLAMCGVLAVIIAWAWPRFKDLRVADQEALHEIIHRNAQSVAQKYSVRPPSGLKLWD